MQVLLNGRYIDVESKHHPEYNTLHQIATVILHAENICTEGSYYDCLVCAQEILDMFRLNTNRELDY